ncbi:hypothetical protein E1180_07635 [Roseibium denhamense]|nr:hypothetical protein [Roseibium denhamense]MTI05385.1 hypothetical protein [Roseibium denhamense]
MSIATHSHLGGDPDSLSARQAALPLAIGGAGLFLQALTYLNHDVAWVLVSSGWLLSGKQFGTDIVAANPPFIWWFSAGPMALSQWIGISPQTSLRLVIGFMILCSLISVNILLRAAGEPANTRAWLLAVAAFVLTIGAGRDFGQREQLTVILLLPYLTAIGVRSRKKDLPWIIGFLIGAFAGFGVVFKPYFLMAVIPVELYLLWKRRAFAMIVRPEAIGAILAVSLCGVSLYIFASPWLTVVLPEIAKTYWGFSNDMLDVLIEYFPIMILILVAAGLSLRPDRPNETAIYLLAAAGFLVSAIWQAKGYSYHGYPALALGTLSIVIAVTSDPATNRIAELLRTCVLATLIGVSLVGIYKRTDAGPVGKHIRQMSEFIETNVPEDGGFFALSTHPFPGFPSALYAHRTWVSASNSAVFLPSVVRLMLAPESQHEASLAHAQEKALTAAKRDLARKPDIILVDVRPHRHAINDITFDFLDFYTRDAGFRQLWSNYEEIGGAPSGFRAYRIKDG